MTVRWHFGTLTEHTAELKAVGWGEPQTIYTSCSCGWRGLTVEEKWFAEDEVEFAHFLEPWRTVARSYGPEHLLSPGSVFGRRETGLVQVLEHLGYDPLEDREHAKKSLDESAGAILAATSIREIEDARRLVDMAANEVVEAFARAKAWAETPRPTPVPIHPEALKLLAVSQA